MNLRSGVSNVRRSIGDLQGDGRGKALLAIASSSFLLIGVQMIYPVVLPELRSTYGFGLGTAGILLTLLWLANAAGQVPGGILADRIGEGTVILVSVVLSGIAVLIIVMARSVVALFVLTMLLGFGIALFGVARYTALEDLFPERVGASVGIVLAAADAGQALLPATAGFIAAAVMWQLGFGYTLPLFVAVAVALWLYVPARTSEVSDEDRDTFSADSIRYVGVNIRRRPVLYGSGAFITYIIIWVTFTGFYPTYLIEIKGLSTTAAGLLFGAFFAVGVAIKPLSGIAYDRVGIRPSLLTITGISCVALIALPFIDSPVFLVAITICIAPILGSGTISQSHIIQALPNDIKGTGLGVIRTGGMTIGAMSPAVFGAIADFGYFDEVFLSLAGFAGLMILLVLQIPSQ